MSASSDKSSATHQISLSAVWLHRSVITTEPQTFCFWSYQGWNRIITADQSAFWFTCMSLSTFYIYRQQSKTKFVCMTFIFVYTWTYSSMLSICFSLQYLMWKRCGFAFLTSQRRSDPEVPGVGFEPGSREQDLHVCSSGQWVNLPTVSLTRRPWVLASCVGASASCPDGSSILCTYNIKYIDIIMIVLWCDVIEECLYLPLLTLWIFQFISNLVKLIKHVS